MKIKNMKETKAITLIALVITIIVLLILAGVAISMLSGENGILNITKGAAKKNEKTTVYEQLKIATMGAMTNEGAKINKKELKENLANLGIEEKDIISYGEDEYVIIKDKEKVIINSSGNVKSGEGITETDIELQKHFNKNGINYNCIYGYLTGFEYDIDQKHTVETVADVEAKLPAGYEIVSKYQYEKKALEGQDIDITESEEYNKQNIYISTGMAIKKGENEVCRIVLFGDTDCNGVINALDKLLTLHYATYRWGTEQGIQDFQKIACNIVNDEEINLKDDKLFKEYFTKNKDINQHEMSEKNVKRLYSQLQQYISTNEQYFTNKKLPYKFEYNEENDTYKLKGVTKDTTVGTLINNLSDLYDVIVISLTPKEDNESLPICGEIDNDASVKDGYYLKLKLEESYEVYFAYIEVKE